MFVFDPPNEKGGFWQRRGGGKRRKGRENVNIREEKYDLHERLSEIIAIFA
jgi:hypothetical protein